MKNKDIEVLESEFKQLRNYVLYEVKHNYKVGEKFAKKPEVQAEVERGIKRAAESLIHNIIDKMGFIIGSENAEILKSKATKHIGLYGYTIALIGVVSYIAWQWYKMNYKMYADQCKTDAGENVVGAEALKTCIIKGRIKALERSIVYMKDAKKNCRYANNPSACVKKFDNRIDSLQNKITDLKRKMILL